jgi:homoserine dehydrogenase
MATALSHARIEAVTVPAECRIAIVGYGTVGGAVARLLQVRRHEFALRVTHICNRNVARKKSATGSRGADIVWTDSLQHVIDSDVDIVVELMGGLEPAHELIRSALLRGKSVVTANKQVIAHFGPRLQQLARDQGLYLGFGACVAGGVPVLSALQDGLAGDRILHLRGILNGTCNYILTRIEQAGGSFAEALVEAQKAGFAEADPTDDLDGQDAAAKLAILARVALKIDAAPEQVGRHSIRAVSAVDFEYAHELGCTIRQISRAISKDGAVALAVGPTLVPLDSQLAKTRGSQNLIVSTGEFGGETTFGGHGAGGDPTAVAIVSDLLHCARGGAQAMPSENHAIQRCEVTSDIQTPHYLRLVVRDRPGIIASLAAVLAESHINLDAVLQKPGHAKSALPFVITLEPCEQRQLNAALAKIADFDFLVEPPMAMPILN